MEKEELKLKKILFKITASFFFVLLITLIVFIINSLSLLQFSIFVSLIIGIFLTFYKLQKKFFSKVNTEIYKEHLKEIRGLLYRAHENISLGNGTHLYTNYQVCVNKLEIIDFTSGDFVIAKEMNDGILLLVGDVVGNGLEASSYVGFISALFLSSKFSCPHETLQFINTESLNIFPKEIGFTACCLLLRHSGEVLYSGFQERIVIIKKDQLHTKYTYGPMLGVKGNISVNVDQFQLELEDGFLLYTDGFYTPELEDRTIVIVTYLPN